MITKQGWRVMRGQVWTFPGFDDRWWQVVWIDNDTVGLHLLDPPAGSTEDRSRTFPVIHMERGQLKIPCFREPELENMPSIEALVAELFRRKMT